MNEPINFDTIKSIPLTDWTQLGYPTYTMQNIEMVGVVGRKFWVIPSNAPSNGLQFIIFWKHTSVPNTKVEVELYRSGGGGGTARGGAKHYTITNDNILTVDNFYEWIKVILRDFEPELSTPL
jgi:hypothetical protein